MRRCTVKKSLRDKHLTNEHSNVRSLKKERKYRSTFSYPRKGKKRGTYFKRFRTERKIAHVLLDTNLNLKTRKQARLARQLYYCIIPSLLSCLRLKDDQQILLKSYKDIGHALNLWRRERMTKVNDINHYPRITNSTKSKHQSGSDHSSGRWTKH